MTTATALMDMTFPGSRPGRPTLTRLDVLGYPQYTTARIATKIQSVISDAPLQIALNNISDLAALPEDWDGDGALALHPSTISNAKNAVYGLAGLVGSADCYPNPNGTVSMQWETSLGRAHLEIGSTRYSFYIKPQRGEPIYAQGLISGFNQIFEQLGSAIFANLYPQAAESVTSIRYAA